MLDLLHEHLASLASGQQADLTDTLGMPMAKFNSLGSGGLAVHDNLGHTIMHVKAVGDHLVQYGELGQTLGSWHEIGNRLVHHNPLGMADQYLSMQGNHVISHNSLGMPQWQYDPLSGAMTNTLGAVQGYLKVRSW